jgi:hypothetical protein
MGIDVEVILIGSTTCGKPYGFVPQDNCGTTYMTIQFERQNQKGFREYPDGFSPINTAATIGAEVNGCSVKDDLTHALGDPQEGLLKTALDYRQTQQCPTPTGKGVKTSSKMFFEHEFSLQPENPFEMMRILTPIIE